MSIRICSGLFGSRRIECPAVGVRPTTDRVKESLFSSLGLDFNGIHVLDLFAGSGNLGIEALSRGAGSVAFVDKSRECISVIKKNLESLDISEKCEVILSDVTAYVTSCERKFDLVFMDPPYNKGLASKLAPHVYNLIADGGLISIEHPPSEIIGMDFWKQKNYGDTMITILRKGIVNEY